MNEKAAEMLIKYDMKTMNKSVKTLAPIESPTKANKKSFVKEQSSYQVSQASPTIRE